MTEPVFKNSAMKLQRAGQFISELESELDRYKNDDPFKATWAFDETPPSVIIEWKAITDLPGAIVGDAVHNLRTALDFMASELVRLKGLSDNDVHFPFGTDSDNLSEQIKKKNFSKAGEDAVALLKTFKPYRGGNDDLRALHDLDVQDKHKSLVLMSSIMNLEVSGSYDIEAFEAANPPIVQGDVYYVFPEPDALKGQPVIETLKKIMHLIKGILEAFATLVALRKSTAV